MTGEQDNSGVGSERKTQEFPAAAFPSARYFQVHFQYLESLLVATKRDVEALSNRLEEIQMLVGDSPAEAGESPHPARRARSRPATNQQQEEDPMENPKKAPSLLLGMVPVSER